MTADDIRDATLCMIRRNDGCNLPAMSRYLATCFPKIPADWRMPIIIAAFTAVQKASAMHGDTLLQGDDERMEWSRRTLARWGHGLGAVEPGLHPPDDEGIPSTASSSARHADKDDPLRWKQLPVPLDSSFAMADAEAALREIPATNPSDAEPIFPPNGSDVEPSGDAARNVIDISAIMDGWGRIGDHANTVSASKEQSSTTIDQELVAESLTTSALNQHFSTIAFDDLLCVETADPELRQMLSRPLSETLSPLTTPKEVRQPSDSPVKINGSSSAGTALSTEPALCVHASPHPSLEDDSVVRDTVMSTQQATSTSHPDVALSKKRKRSTKTSQQKIQDAEDLTTAVTDGLERQGICKPAAGDKREAGAMPAKSKKSDSGTDGRQAAGRHGDVVERKDLASNRRQRSTDRYPLKERQSAECRSSIRTESPRRDADRRNDEEWKRTKINHRDGDRAWEASRRQLECDLRQRLLTFLPPPPPLYSSSYGRHPYDRHPRWM